MADYLPVSLPTRKVAVPLTLTALQTYVGGFVRFVELKSGDWLVINEASLDDMGFHNQTASTIAGMKIHGDAILCHPSEIA